MSDRRIMGAEPEKVEKKSFKVAFNTKFSKQNGKKKGLASKKLDEELDFNKMSLGDQIDPNSINKKKDLFVDLYDDFDNKQKNTDNNNNAVSENNGAFIREEKIRRKLSDEEKHQEM